ncbi:Trm112 family protein [Umezawaea sp.]|uniref:Trm112 family protein n=1 Tax=Umezawaea sp. TaxID=1955258 RepID=UPI002ED427EE
MAVQLDAQLLDILACPCPEHGALLVGAPLTGASADPAEWDQSANFLTCSVCHRSYPVTDGIPVLLLDEAVRLDADQDPTAG